MKKKGKSDQKGIWAFIRLLEQIPEARATTVGREKGRTFHRKKKKNIYHLISAWVLVGYLEYYSLTSLSASLLLFRAH